MTDPNEPSSTSDLHRRVKAAQDRNSSASKERTSTSSHVGSGMGVGLKVGVDLVVGVGVGGVIGWGLDWWLGTKPYLLAIFTFPFWKSFATYEFLGSSFFLFLIICDNLVNNLSSIFFPEI